MVTLTIISTYVHPHLRTFQYGTKSIEQQLVIVLSEIYNKNLLIYIVLVIVTLALALALALGFGVQFMCL